MRHLRTCFVLLLPLAVIACEPPEAEEPQMEEEAVPAAETAPMMDEAAMEDELNQIRDDWVLAAEGNDAAGVASLYADNAIMVGPDGQRLEGPQAIQEALSQSFPSLASMDVTSLHTEYSGDLVTDMGTYTQTFQAEGGEETVEGTYLVVMQRQPDGSWKIIQHLGASPMQMEAPAPEDQPMEAAEDTGEVM